MDDFSSTGWSNSTDTLCEDFRCTLIPATRVGEVLACGLPFVFTLMIARAILKANTFRLDRSNFVMDLNLSVLNRNPFSYETHAPLFTKLLKAITLSPLLAAIFWCVMVYVLLHEYYEYHRLPTAVAFALASLCSIICLGSYGFLHWQASNFRMTFTTGLCFVLCVCIILALQLGFTLFVIDKAPSAYIVFMSFNLAPIMLLSYLHHVIAPPITFQQMLRIQGRDPKFEQECAALQKKLSNLKIVLMLLSISALVVFSLLMHYLFDSVFGYQVSAAVLFCDFATYIHNISGMSSDPMLLHGLSFFARGVLFAAWTDRWFVAVSINFLVFIAFFIYHIIDQRHPLFSKEDALDSVVGSIESAMDEKRMEEQAARVAAHEEANRAMREMEEKAAIAQGGANLGLQLKHAAADLQEKVDQFSMAVKNHIPGARFVSDGAGKLEAGAREFAEELERKTSSLFRSPEFALTILSLIYVVYTLIALYAELKNPSWNSELFPQIPTSAGRTHPQYQVGLISALVLLAATLFFLAFRTYEMNNFHWNRQVGITGMAFLIVSIGSSIGVSFVTESHLIYVFGIYLPLIAVISTLTYCNWRRQDYRWNGWIHYQIAVWRKQVKAKKEQAAKDAREDAEIQRRHTQSQLERETERNSADSIRMKSVGSVSKNDPTYAQLNETTDENFEHSKPPQTINLFPFSKKLGDKFSLNLKFEYDCPHDWKDFPPKDPKFTVYMLADFLAFKHTAPDYIILVCVGLVTCLCVSLGLHLAAYEDKAESYFIASAVGMVIFTIFVLLKWFNTFTVGYIQVGVLGALLTHCSTALHTSISQGDTYSIGLALLYPAGMLIIMGGYSWKMNNWKLSPVIKRCIFLACVFILAYIICFMAITEHYLEGVIVLVAYGIAVFFVVLVMVWSSEDFHLPRKYFIAAVVVSALLMLAALIVIVILNKTWFQMFTVLWAFSLVALLAYTIQETRESETRKLLPSPYIFPIYEYQPNLTAIQIKVRNNGIIALIIFAALMMCWGFIAALLIQPPWVGWVFFCCGSLLAFLIAMEALFKPIIEFWRNFRIVIDAPALIEHARETALASQLGTQEQAFGDDDNAEDNQEDEADTNVALGSEDDGYKTLRRLQLYWNFEERSEVVHLERERAKYIAHPRVPDDLDVSARAKFIAETISAYDAKIAKCFEEQTRIVVMFQLLINIGAQALQKKNRARVKDFLRQYFARKMEVQAAKEAGLPIPKRRRTTVANPSGSSSGPAQVSIGGQPMDESDEDDLFDDYPLIDLSKANAVEIKEWAAKNEELKKRAMRYVQELQESGVEARRKQEEQRAAAAERQRKTAAQGVPLNVAGNVSVPSTPARGGGGVQEMKSVDSPRSIPQVSPTSPSHAASVTPLKPLPPPTFDTATLTNGDVKKVLKDDFDYRRRQISFDINNLNIAEADMQTAVRKAREAVKEIIARHGKVMEANKAQGIDDSSLFSDPFFPVVQDLDQLIDAGTDPAEKDLTASSKVAKKRKACWKRLREISPNPKVFASTKLDPAVIIQGSLEDCYLLSALSVIAKSDAKRIRDLFLVDEYNAYGIYGMTFFVDGLWRAVFVDDQFPFLSNELAFARSKNPDEFWVPILEKCYAKLYAGYPSIIGGLVHVSFKDLTGGITDEVALDSQDSGAFDGRLWQRLYSYNKEKYLMGCGNPKPHAGNFTAVNGIVQGHAYAILQLLEVGDIKLIQLRNPWGEGEWEGDWGDNSDKWTQKMRTLCNYEDSVENDGIFWMSFEDFAVQFQRVYICRVFNHVVELTMDGTPVNKAALNTKSPTGELPWCKASLKSEWRGGTAAGHVCHVKKFPDRKPENNPQFLLRLKDNRSGIVFLTLTQQTRTGGEAYFFISLLVLTKGGKRARDIKKSEIVGGNTKCRNSREICAEVNLEANKEYTIFVSTYDPNQETSFTLSAYCRYPIALAPIDPKAPVS